MRNKKVLVLLGIIILFITSCSTNKVTFDKDSLVNSNWQFQGDKSQINFEEDNNFKYYQSKDKLDDYYYTGEYELYTGEDAIKYITEDLESYGVTKSELDRILSSNKKYNKDNFICLVLNNKEQIIEGKNELKDIKKTPYFGFYFNEAKEYMDIANMDTGNYSTLAKVK